MWILKGDHILSEQRERKMLNVSARDINDYALFETYVSYQISPSLYTFCKEDVPRGSNRDNV